MTPPLDPRPSSVPTVRPATVSTPQTHTRPPKVLARAPLWMRIPALRSMTETVAGSQSQVQGTPAAAHAYTHIIGTGVGPPAPPPIVLPDRVGTTRLLLSDTQACVQKLSARMDALGARGEQALKEVQLAREALDSGGEKTVAEIVDVVYKCQATLMKSVEAQGNLFDKANDRITHLTASNEAYLKLYEAQAASLASLSQTVHSNANAHQFQCSQLTQLASTLSPLEPLVRAIPLHIDTALTAHLSRITDALAPALERAVERGLEYVLARLPAAAYMHNEGDRGERIIRGQKRKHAFDEDIPSADAVWVRQSSMAIPSSDAQTNHEPSSPLLHRQRSGIWNAARLRSRSSLRPVPIETTPASNENREIPDETKTPAPPQKTRAPSLSLRTTRRPTLRAVDPSTVARPAFKRPRSRSAALVSGAVGGNGGKNADNDAVAQAEINMDIDCAVSSIAVGTSTEAGTGITSASCRSTHSAALVHSHTSTIAPRRAPLEPRQSMCLLVDQGPGEGTNDSIHTQILPAPMLMPGSGSGSEYVGPTPVAADTASATKAKSKAKAVKSKSKATKPKGSGTGKRKGKKVATAPDAIPVPALPSAPLSSDVRLVELGDKNSDAVPKSNSDSKTGSKEKSPKRTTTGASDTSLVSVASVHGPPNSPSMRAAAGSLRLPSSLNENGPADGDDKGLENAPASVPAMSNPTSGIRSLIDIMAESPDSSPPVRGGEGDGTGLAAALAHVHSDIDFASGLGADTEQREDVDAGAKMELGIGYDVDFFNRLQQMDGSSSVGASVLFNQPSGRPKRFLFVDDDSAGIDLWSDQLLDD